VLAVVTQFLETAAARLEAGRRAGVVAAVQHAEAGVGERLHRSRQWLAAHHAELAVTLGAPLQ
jgi:hypothetical protein